MGFQFHEMKKRVDGEGDEDEENEDEEGGWKGRRALKGKEGSDHVGSTLGSQKETSGMGV